MMSRRIKIRGRGCQHMVDAVQVKSWHFSLPRALQTWHAWCPAGEARAYHWNLGTRFLSRI